MIRLIVLSFYLCLSGLTTAQVAMVPSSVNKAGDILARGPGSMVVTTTDIMSEFNKMTPAMRQEFFKTPENVQQIANNLLVRRILAEEAVQNKLGEDLVVQAAMAVAKDRVLSDARLNQMDKANEPDEKALEAYARNKYQATFDKYQVPSKMRASHILIQKKDDKSYQQAMELLNKLKAGADFAVIAKEYSKDPGSAARGGDLGYFGEGQMVKVFEEAAKALEKPGDLSMPVESDFGYHIIRLDDRKPKSTLTFEEVKGTLLAESRAEILSQKRVLKVQNITTQMKFERDAILEFTKDALATMSAK